MPDEPSPPRRAARDEAAVFLLPAPPVSVLHGVSLNRHQNRLKLLSPRASHSGVSRGTHSHLQGSHIGPTTLLRLHHQLLLQAEHVPGPPLLHGVVPLCPKERLHEDDFILIYPGVALRLVP